MSTRDHISQLVRAAGLFAAYLLLPLHLVLSVGYVSARQFVHFRLTPLQELPYQWIVKSLLPIDAFLLVLGGAVVTVRNFKVHPYP